MTRPSIQYDPFSREDQADPYPHYARLREQAPVHRLEGPGFYLVSRYQDVAFVLKSPELFSSRAMMQMMMSGMSSGITNVGSGGLDAGALELIRDLLEGMPFSPMEILARPSVIASDPPNHQRLRSLVNRGFTPRRIGALEPRVREIAREAIDAMLRKDEIDLVADLTIPLPVRVISELLGVETERQEDFKRWSDSLVSGATGSSSGTRPEAMLASFKEFNAYMMEAIERRRAEPGDDLISVLVAAEGGEAGLTPSETLMFTVLLLVAGNETTTNLMGNALNALLDHPDQLERVRRDPRRIPAMIEETLRYESPVQFLFREATQDVELAGSTIPQGAIVLPAFGSANRDEAQFPEADRFDIERDARGHLAFGFGIHFCLGASLARLEARVGFEELLSRVAKFERREPEVEYVDSFLLRGLQRLPLACVPAVA